jgi:hypothetical protein
LTPGKGGVQADIVVTAPGSQVPLPFVEVDNCFFVGLMRA